MNGVEKDVTDEKDEVCRDVEFRFLCPEDTMAIKKLCRDWFPIEYPHNWYKDITSNSKFFSLAAVHSNAIVGLIVAEIKPQSKCNREDQGLLSYQFSKVASVAYILTLGVVKHFRRKKIASLLLENLIKHLTTSPSTQTCKALYLHVLTTNLVAISFYERRKFRKHMYLPLYYSINGSAKDGYSYVLYINGGQPPWNLLQPFCEAASDIYSLVSSSCSATVSTVSEYVCVVLQVLSPRNPLRCLKKAFFWITGAASRAIFGSPSPNNKYRHLANA